MLVYLLIKHVVIVKTNLPLKCYHLPKKTQLFFYILSMGLFPFNIERNLIRLHSFGYSQIDIYIQIAIQLLAETDTISIKSWLLEVGESTIAPLLEVDIFRCDSKRIDFSSAAQKKPHRTNNTPITKFYQNQQRHTAASASFIDTNTSDQLNVFFFLQYIISCN